MASLKAVLKQLQAEVDEAKEALFNEMIAVNPAPQVIQRLKTEWVERVARLDKARGAT